MSSLAISDLSENDCNTRYKEKNAGSSQKETSKLFQSSFDAVRRVREDDALGLLYNNSFGYIMLFFRFSFYRILFIRSSPTQVITKSKESSAAIKDRPRSGT